MGQEQSYSHSSIARTESRLYKNDGYTSPPLEYRPSSYDKDYKRHKARRSADSFKSDNSSTESSGYRSGSSLCECRSTKSDYYCTSLYKNDHYKDINKEIYKPVKIPKEKRYKLQLFDLQKEEIKSSRMKGYMSEPEKSQPKINTGTSQKNTGIRNYTPKILSEEEQKKKLRI